MEMSGESSCDALGRALLNQVLEMASRSIHVPDMICEVTDSCRRVLVLPSCERHDAVRLAEETIHRVE